MENCAQESTMEGWRQNLTATGDRNKDAQQKLLFQEAWLLEEEVRCQQLEGVQHQV